MSDNDLDDHLIAHLIGEFEHIIDGGPMAETLAAMSCVITDILSNIPESQHEALLMFNSIVMTISTNVHMRIENNECAWQNRKQ